MFSLSNDTMSKMTENNPLLAMMPNSEMIKKSTDAWMKAMPSGDAAANPFAMAVATSAMGWRLYGEMVGMMFNPLDPDLGEDEPKAEATPKAEPVKKAAAPKAKPAEKPTPVTAKKIAVEDVKPVVVKKAAPKAEAKAKTSGKAPAEAVAAQTQKPTGMDRPDSPDDLKLIAGIGPKLEQVLNGMGIWTYKQIENWSAPEIAWIDDFLQFSGRIERDEWQAQAAKLRNA